MSRTLSLIYGPINIYCKITFKIDHSLKVFSSTSPDETLTASQSPHFVNHLYTCKNISIFYVIQKFGYISFHRLIGNAIGQLPISVY